jgi:hypothetical protein
VSQNDRRSAFTPGISLALASATLAIASALGAACTARSPRPAAAPAPARAILGLDGQPDTREDAAFVETVRRECTVCHVAARASDLPRAQWRLRLQDMARFSLTGVGVPEARLSGLAQLDLEPFVRYFEARAPETLAAPEAWPAPAAQTGFERTTLSPKGAAPVPIIADARFLDLDGDGRPEIVACDMGHGLVFVGDPLKRPGELREIAKIPNPVRASLADLDKDGRQDLLIADVGFFMPEDNTKGSVVWLRAKGDGTYEKHVLAEKLPRVMDVQALDFDGDGDLDLIVAAAGLYARGELLLLENRTTDWKQPRFEPHVLDTRSGALQVAVADLDDDRSPDLVVLFGQQQQKLVAFYNRGAGHFEPRTLFTAPTPAWGATGIQLVDFDADGDLDVLITSGESMDDATVKPWHGVSWLENAGRVPWQRHALAALPGAHRAVAADLDGDGDIDVVVSAFLPDPDHTHGALTSLGWLEQQRPGIFERHALQAGQLSHFGMDAADVDGDGRVDLVAGNLVGFTFARTDTGFRADGWLELWTALARPVPASPK